MKIINSISQKLLLIFNQYRYIERTINFIKYLDEVNLTDLKPEIFNWLNIDDFEMQLVEFQSNPIRKKKFIKFRSDLEIFQRKRLIE